MLRALDREPRVRTVSVILLVTFTCLLLVPRLIGDCSVLTGYLAFISGFSCIWLGAGEANRRKSGWGMGGKIHVSSRSMTGSEDGRTQRLLEFAREGERKRVCLARENSQGISGLLREAARVLRRLRRHPGLRISNVSSGHFFQYLHY